MIRYIFLSLLICLISLSCSTIQTSSLYRGLFCGKKISFDYKFRRRPLKEMQRALGSFSIDKFISSSLDQNPNFKVFEFGVGFAPVLIELNKIYPSISTIGLNENIDYQTCNKYVLAENAVSFGIYDSIEQVSHDQLPFIYFHDVEDGLLNFFPDNMFNLIISQVSFQYILRKDILINEFFRILKPGGQATFTVSALKVIDGKGQEVSLQDFASLASSKDCEISYEHVYTFPQRDVITIKKHNNANFKLATIFKVEESGANVRNGGTLTVLQLR